MELWPFAPLEFTIFLAILGLLQVMLVFWAHRRTAAAPITALVAFLPLIGLPYLLYRDRRRIRDNHIAGALTYLVLFVGAVAFLSVGDPALFVEDAEGPPWSVIYTMQLFSFLGVLNLIATDYKE